MHCLESRGILQARLGISKGFSCAPAFFLRNISGAKEEAQLQALLWAAIICNMHRANRATGRGSQVPKKGAQGDAATQKSEWKGRELDVSARQGLGGSSEAVSGGDHRGESFLTKPSAGEAPTESPLLGSSRCRAARGTPAFGKA